MPLRVCCLRQSRSSLRGSSDPLSELSPTRILFRNLPPTSTLKSQLSPSLIMVPDKNSQLGTGTNAQGQQSWWYRLGEALRDPFLIRHTKEKLEEQIPQKIDSISIEQDIAGKMNEEVEGKVKEVKDNLKKEIVNELEKDYKNLKNKITELNNRATAAIYTIVAIATLGTILGAPIINNILSLDVLEADIKIIKEDVEDLRESQMQN